MNRLIDCQLPHLGIENMSASLSSAANRIESMEKYSMTIFGIVLTLVIAIKIDFICIFVVCLLRLCTQEPDMLRWNRHFCTRCSIQSVDTDSHNYRVIHVVIPNWLLYHLWALRSQRACKYFSFTKMTSYISCRSSERAREKKPSSSQTPYDHIWHGKNQILWFDAFAIPQTFRTLNQCLGLRSTSMVWQHYTSNSIYFVVFHKKKQFQTKNQIVDDVRPLNLCQRQKIRTNRKSNKMGNKQS